MVLVMKSVVRSFLLEKKFLLRQWVGVQAQGRCDCGPVIVTAPWEGLALTLAGLFMYLHLPSYMYLYLCFQTDLCLWLHREQACFDTSGPIHASAFGRGRGRAGICTWGLMALWPKVQQQNTGGVFCTFESIVHSRAEALAQCMLWQWAHSTGSV